MATAPQAAMEMPQQGASPFDDPNTTAIYDQMRQTISPKEFGDELLTSASQASPEEVAAFRDTLDKIDMPPQVLDALNNVVDEILASPDRYDELREKYMKQGLPEEILPEQFDPQFFVALNMAIDQMIAEPSGVQSFAKGGIAELKPIAKAIASYGRNGDTMLAHITPAEARMLRRRGGAGTTNPDTGLLEFGFLSSLWKTVTSPLKTIGKAVQSFAKSTVGKVVLTVALAYFVGPVVAAQFGVAGGTVAAGAISGFVGGAGSTLLAGGSLKDSLRAGAIGGITGGAIAGLSGAPLTGTSALTPGQAFTGQVDAFKGMLPGGAPVAAATTSPVSTGVANAVPLPTLPPLEAASAGAANADSLDTLLKSNNAFGTLSKNPLSNSEFGAAASSPVSPTNSAYPESLANTPALGSKPPSLVDQAKDFYTNRISPEGIQKAGIPAAEKAGTAASDALMARDATATSAMREAAYQTAYKKALPGMLSTYGPMAGLGLGALSAFGGFETKPAQGGDITRSLMKPATQRIAEKGTQRQVYSQDLPGVVYDQYGAPIYGQSTRLPTYDVPDYSGGYGMPQGSMNLPPLYTAPPGSIGSRSVAQPYNNSDMYPNLVPRRAAEGGSINTAGYAEGGSVSDLYRSILRREPSAAEIEPWKAQFGDTIDDSERAKFRETAGPELASNAAVQKAARDAAAQEKAMRRSKGSSPMYNNVMHGMSIFAPETNPMDPTDTGFGERSRQALKATLLSTKAPMFQNQRDSMAQQKTNLRLYDQMVKDQYAGVGRTGFGNKSSQIDPSGFNYFVNQLETKQISPSTLSAQFTGSVKDYMGKNPNDRYTQYMQQYQQGMEPPAANPYSNITTPNTLPPASRLIQSTLQPGKSPIQPPLDPYKPVSVAPSGGIAGLAQGGYPRRNGQINGPGTEKSDSIPAMLSDGEFVMTAKAVRGAGKGSRRAGAKKMYTLMHQLEKNSERG